MEEKTKVLVVDDILFMRELAAEVLGADYQILMAENGADALMLAQSEHPALILLDVEMPGMDGYETCRQLKQAEATASVPVIFVSAHDQIEERLKGYEVGGNDYIVKPFDPQELKAKIAHLLGMFSERTQLKEMVGYATSTAMTAMTSMSEMGALLEALKKFNASRDEKALGAAVLSGLSLYGLEGVVQVRMPEKTLTLSGQGEASPLEVSVINHMTRMERIVHFKRKMSIHYPHVAILVSNMPEEDPDRCGRLRDHLATLVEGAEMRTAGIVAENESRRRGLDIERMAERVTEALNEIDAAQRRNHMEIRMASSGLTEAMDQALRQVELTKEQESFLSAVVADGIEKIIGIQSDETAPQNKLTAIVQELKEIADFRERNQKQDAAHL